MLCTGVAKSSTSRRCARFGGSVALDRSTHDLGAFALEVRGGAGAGEADDDAAFAVLAAAEVDVGNFEAVDRHRLGRIGRCRGDGGDGRARCCRRRRSARACCRSRSSVAAGRNRSTTTRVRPAASIAEMAEVAPAPTSMRRCVTPLRVSARSIAMRGGDSVVKICGADDGLRELQRDLDLAAWQGRVARCPRARSRRARCRRSGAPAGQAA